MTKGKLEFAKYANQLVQMIPIHAKCATSESSFTFKKPIIIYATCVSTNSNGRVKSLMEKVSKL